MARLDGWFDPELEELFRDDQSLMETAHLLHSSRPDAQADPGFQRRLRTELMVEARRTLQPRGYRRFGFRLRMGHLALGGAGLGVALAAATVLTLLGSHVEDHQTIEEYSNVAAQHAVSPDDVITVAFNQPMDEAAVVKGLSIRPATQVTTSWQGNNLVITPTHHLAGNTPYTVTIAQPALRTTSGTTAAAPVEIAFGTAPTPTPAAQPPSLSPTVLGNAGPQFVLYAPDGGIVASNVAPAAGTTPIASPGAASPSPAATTAASSGAGAAGLTTAEFTPGGATKTLGPASTAAAFSPNGSTFAYASPDGHGGSDVVVSGADGSSPHTLVDSPAPVAGLTWASNDLLAYSTGFSVRHVDLSGSPGATVPLPSGYTAFDVLAPGASWAYLAAPSGEPGGLLDLASGAVTPLSGSERLVAFNATGSVVAWVDSSGAPRLWTEPTSGGTPAAIATLQPGAPISGLALSADGRSVAYVQGSGAAAQLIVARVANGAPIAVGPAPAALAFSAQGDSIALLVTGSAGTQVEQAALPGVQAQLPQALPPAAASVLNTFVAAQVSGTTATLQQLSAGDVDAPALTPPGLSRAYQIDAVANADDIVHATVELIVDPSATQTTPLVAGESLTLAPDASGAYQVVGMQAEQLHAESTGPHVMNVSSAPGAAGTEVISVRVDSDLNPATVINAVTVSAAGQQLQPLSIQYDPDSRTVTVTVNPGGASSLDVMLGQSLQDVDGNALAAPFTAQVAA